MADWGHRIAEATDLETLASIDADLAKEDLAARKWRFIVVQRRNALLGKVSPTAVPVKPVAAFAANYGLPAPDGRRLHAYRLDGAQFDALQRDLAKCSGVAALQTGHRPALFVLWASEWFRRCYRGGMRRWEDLVQALGLPSPGQAEQNVLRAVTRAGLQQWQRPVYADAMMQYLATLAREGGFPAFAVADGGRGWAKDLLSAIVGPLMGAPAAGEAEALDLAKGKAGVLPGVFNDSEFIQLCADLAFAIVELRREAEPYARAAGLPLAAWLGLNRPGWREALPISTGDAAADALVEVLMEVEAVSGSIVGVERMLLQDQACLVWREAVRIGLDGQVSGGAMVAVDGSFGRLRAFAAGSMARHLPGELALFDPPVDGDKAWSARSARHVRGIVPLPFACPVQLDLRAGEQPVARIDLPGGKPRRGQLLVATLEKGSLDEPTALRIIGSGSGNYRAEALFLQVPANWAVLPVSGGEVAEIGSGSDGTKLWRVAGGARLTDPLNDCYRVLCGQAADQTARIDLMGDTPGWAEVQGAVEGDDSEAALAELIRLTAGLRGLPPVTFNVFKPLSDFPLVLAKLTYRASEAERDAIMGLAQALPFAWFLIPRTCWDEAENAAGRAAMELLKALSDAPRFAMQMVETTRRALIERQPLLEAVFSVGDADALPNATQAFLRRAMQRIPAGDGTRYRARLGDRLPDYFLRFDTTILDTLDAPCAAALAVQGAWTPTSDDIRHLKLMARTFPTWFSEAFAAWM